MRSFLGKVAYFQAFFYCFSNVGKLGKSFTVSKYSFLIRNHSIKRFCAPPRKQLTRSMCSHLLLSLLTGLCTLFYAPVQVPGVVAIIKARSQSLSFFLIPDIGIVYNTFFYLMVGPSRLWSLSSTKSFVDPQEHATLAHDALMSLQNLRKNGANPIIFIPSSVLQMSFVVSHFYSRAWISLFLKIFCVSPCPASLRVVVLLNHQYERMAPFCQKCTDLSL